MARSKRVEEDEEEREEIEDLFPPGSECHELFLPDNKDDQPIAPDCIGRISIKRIHPWEEHAGTTFSPTEIKSPSDISDRWGGGVYIVIARRHNGTILPGATRKINLGASKAYQFVAGARERDDAQTAAHAGAAAVVEMPKQADPTVVMMLATMERMARDSDASRKESATIMSNMMSSLSNALTAALARPTPIAAAAAPAGEDKSADQFRAGMEFAFEQVTDMRESLSKRRGGEDENGESDDASLIKNVVEGIKAARDIAESDRK